MAESHANYNIGTNAANRWVEHMEKAIDDHEALKDDDEAKELMKKYFAYTAHYIVAAMAYMRSDQVRICCVLCISHDSIFLFALYQQFII